MWVYARTLSDCALSSFFSPDLRSVSTRGLRPGHPPPLLQLGRERALRGQHADDRACTGDRYRRARHTPVHAFARERRRFHTPTLARRSPAAQWKVNGRLVGAGHGGESCHATARRRVSGEEQLVQVSSRLILRLSRLKFASMAVRSVGCGCQAGRALERAVTWTAGFLLRGGVRPARTSLYLPPPG